MGMNMNSGLEGTYGGYTAPTQEFVAGRRADMERAIAFAEEESKREQ
jgi:hypothetical protein